MLSEPGRTGQTIIMPVVVIAEDFRLATWEPLRAPI